MAKYACGCVVQSSEPGVPAEVKPCAEHGAFTGVRRALRTLREALTEAHEQLPPGPKEAA
jgi:hypothetical protein